MTKLSKEKIEELNLVGKINKRMLKPMGINMLSGEFEFIPGFKKQEVENVTINESQFNYLLALCNSVTSGANPSDKVVETARLYLLERDKFNSLKGDRSTKSIGKRVAVRRLIPTHNVLTNWPADTKDKIKAYSIILGGRTPGAETISAVVDHIDNGLTVSKASTKNGVNYASTQSVVNRIAQFDEAVEEYLGL